MNPTLVKSGEITQGMRWTAKKEDSTFFGLCTNYSFVLSLGSFCTRSLACKLCNA